MWNRPSPALDDEPEQEWARVEAWELARFISLGFRDRDASELAALGVSWHDAAPLIRDGCPHKLARRLLLPT